MNRGRRWLAALTVAAAAAATWSAGARLEREAGARPGQPLLYLPNGRHLKLMSLGHDSLVADAIYLWAIQFYSNYDRADRFRYVRHVFDGVITELDPHYVDAYWLGAMILIVEAHDLDAGLALLDKGIRNNPQEWILPYLAAWESHHAGRYRLAEEYFGRAATVPGAPPVVVRMRAGMRGKTGDLAGSIRMWEEIADDPASDARSVAIAQRQVRELGVRLDLGRLRESIERFRNENGRLPADLEELQARRYIAVVPRDPSGRVYPYDPRDGSVNDPGGRMLDGR